MAFDEECGVLNLFLSVESAFYYSRGSFVVAKISLVSLLCRINGDGNLFFPLIWFCCRRKEVHGAVAFLFQQLLKLLLFRACLAKIKIGLKLKN